MKTTWRRWLGPILGLAVMGWLLSRMDFHLIGQSWRQISFTWWLASFFVGLLGQILRAVRWRYLLLSVRAVPLRKLFSALMIGQATTWLLPFRMGEVGGAYALSRMEPLKFTTIMGSVFTDRLLDVIWLIGALVYVLAFFSLETVVIPRALFGAPIEISRGLLVHAAQVLGFICIAGAVFLILFYVWQSRMVRLIHVFLDPLSASLASRTERLCRSFSDGLHVLRNGRHAGTAVLATLGYWVLGQIGVVFLIASYPLGLAPSMSLSLLVLVSVAAGLALPNAPGYVGTLHLAIVMGLLLGNPDVDVNLALGFAVFYHLNLLVPYVLVGALFMWIDGLSFMPGRLVAAESDHDPRS